MPIHASVTNAIGRTPLVRLQRIPAAWGCAADLVLKLEGANPARSVKDRIAASMVDAAERSGAIAPDRSVLVEATSGNTGIGLAMVCAARGYRLVLTMPENMSRERQQLLRAYGAEVVLTPAEADMAGAIARANELIATLPGAFSPQQFANPANPKVHYATTGPEIWADTDGQVAALVVGVGTGGTLTGAGRYLKERNPALKILAVEPSESPVLSGGEPRHHDLQGLGPGFVPDVLRTDLIDDIATVCVRRSYEISRRLAREEGIVAGISTGAIVAAALDLGCDEAWRDRLVVAIAPSAGERYLSTPLWQEAPDPDPIPTGTGSDP